MREDVSLQLNKVKKECYILSQMVNYDRLRLEYNKSNRYNDEGKLDMMPIFHCYST